MIGPAAKEDCCGCNACGDACPRGAISFHADEEGFLYPEVDRGKCVDCGICDRVCPMLHLERLKEPSSGEPKCIACNHKNLQIRFDSTSGGAFTALAEPMLKQGGKIGGAIYTEDWHVRQIVTGRESDLPALRSSKYIQSDARGFYAEVKAALEGGEPLLAVGLPCQIAALRLFLGKGYDSLVTVDLICRYINSPLAYQKYLRYLEREYGARVVAIKAKNKELGWRQLTHKVVFQNHDTYYGTFAVDKFMQASMKCNCLSRPACYSCRFKGFPRTADLTIGDYWVRGERPAMDDDTGTSVVLLNTEKGKRYFEKAASRLKTEEVALASVIAGNPALVRPLPKASIDRRLFYEKLASKEFDAVVDELCPQEQLTARRKLRNIAAVLRQELKLSRGQLRPLFQFIHLNFFHPAVKSAITERKVIFIAPHCVFEIHRDARIELKGPLTVGKSPFRKTSVETRLRMGKGSRMLIGNFGGNGYGFGYGSDIELFNGAALISKGGPSTNMNTTIICMNRITIGEVTAIGRNVTIRDNNGGHLININGYRDSMPVVIGEHVWLCEGCTVLSGVKIGDGTIVGAHAVVTRSLPAHVSASGNPVKIGMENIEWKM